MTHAQVAGNCWPVYNSAPRLTGLESLAVPSGFPTTVPYITREHLNQRPTGTVLLNPDGVSAWKSPEHDVWREHGVWDVDAQGRPRVLRDDYFARVRFGSDGLRPFLHRSAKALSAVHPGALCFIEGEPGSGEPPSWESDSPVVNASHWYDLLTLTTKHYDPAAALVWGTDQTVQGAAAVRESFARQIAAHVEDSRRFLNGAPTLIGEFGLPFDLDSGAAFRSGDFSSQVAALSAYYDALDANLVPSALWNYTSDNTNDQGDGWNGEDLSIFSRDQQGNPEDPDSGGRAVAGFCRPTLRTCAGRPLSQSFNRATGEFVLTIEASGADVPTSVYVPRIHYPHGIISQATAGKIEYDPAKQVLRWRDVGAGIQRLTISWRVGGPPDRRRNPPSPASPVVGCALERGSTHPTLVFLCLCVLCDLCGEILFSMHTETVQVRSILTRASGYLETVCSHSLQPYRGCPLGASLCGVGCYVRHNVYVTQGREWGRFLEARTNAAASYRAGYERERAWGREQRGGFIIFLSSATEPFPPQEARFGITRSVLEAMRDQPPDGLIVQTHSHRVTDFGDRLLALSRCCDLRVHLSIETDRARLPGLPPPASTVAQRFAAARALRERGVRVVITVAPLLPIADPERFFARVAESAEAVVLDHFIGGDGSPQGGRTLKTPLPAAMLAVDPDSVHLAYRDRMGAIAQQFLPGRVGYGREGFAGRWGSAD